MKLKTYSNNLSSLQTVRRRVHAGKVQFPYIITFSVEKQEFTLFGTYHTRSPSDSIFNRIKIMLDEFVKRHPDGVVIAENSCRDADKNSLTEAIQQVGDSGVVHWHAHSRGLTIICPEPPYAQVIGKLCQRFDPEDVAYTMLVSALTPHFREKASPEKIERALDYLLKYWVQQGVCEAAKFVPAKEWFIKYHTKGKGNLRINDSAFWQQKSTPFSDEIMYKAVQIRDEVILAELVKLWEKGKSIFMVYGGEHILHLEPAIERLTGVKPKIITGRV